MPEQTITATHLRQNLGAVLESVLKGRTVHVIRNGRPLCTLVPTDVHEALVDHVAAKTKQ
jgi:antitoxin (DNA-binding transcriptional repressor) of toxin-antitoxin stability system